MNKSFIRGIAFAVEAIHKEYDIMHKEHPRQLDGYTKGWMTQMLISQIEKQQKRLKRKKKK